MKNYKIMKTKLFFILCLCVLSMNVWAKPDIVRHMWGEVWSLYREYSLVDGQREHRTDHYFAIYDTTISSYSYRKVFWREEGDYTKEVSAGYALREDSIRVYVYDYASQKEYVFFDFSLKENDILAMEWIAETENRKNPVFRVLAVGDTTITNPWWDGGGRKDYHYLKVYDTVHQVTDMWLSEIGSVSHGIAWHRDFETSSDTLETVLCVDGGSTYRNPAYSSCSCYIPKTEPEYVSFKGKLILMPEPQFSSAELDCECTLIAIKWGELTPFLSYNSLYGDSDYPIEVQGVEYREGDSVEVEGYISIRRDIVGQLYSKLDIENIRKISVTSVEKQPRAELILSPNPAKETITLRTTGCNLQHVEILDVNGRVLYTATLNGTETFDYNVSQIPSGIYLARVKASCGILTEKFSVK